MADNLAYIEELGISEDLAINDTEVEANETTEESNEDLNSDSEVSTSEDTIVDTEQPSELDSLRKQIEGMEKRIADKDDFISELRDASKQKEAEKQSSDTEVEADDDFWDNPEEKYKGLQEQLRIQQMQIQETVYSNTVDNYWKTVNPDALKEAVATDADFADTFNKSSEPYKVAFEYLNKQQDAKKTKDSEYRESIRQELLKEMNVKDKREAPPSINTSGKSQSTATKAPDDGFASVFGAEY